MIAQFSLAACFFLTFLSQLVEGDKGTDNNAWIQYINMGTKWYGSAAYKTRRRFADKIEPKICNMPAKEQNGTTFTQFLCPKQTETDTTEYCCGDDSDEHCCRFWDSPWRVAALVAGLVIFTLIIVGICVGCWCKSKHCKGVRESCCQKKNPNISPSTTNANEYKVRKNNTPGTNIEMRLHNPYMQTNQTHGQGIDDGRRTGVNDGGDFEPERHQILDGDRVMVNKYVPAGISHTKVYRDEKGPKAHDVRQDAPTCVYVGPHAPKIVVPANPAPVDAHNTGGLSRPARNLPNGSNRPNPLAPPPKHVTGIVTNEPSGPPPPYTYSEPGNTQF